MRVPARWKVKALCVLGAAMTLTLAGCSGNVNPRVATRLNRDAALTGDLPLNPLRGKVITSWIDKTDGTMSTLYGNDVAVHYARSISEGKYPAGSALQVVTWKQQEDPRWFGGKIPSTAVSVEYVGVTGQSGYSYERFEGSPLKKTDSESGAVPNGRSVYLLAQRASVMP